jgi:ketosteroid isomerase-like protein
MARHSLDPFDYDPTMVTERVPNMGTKENAELVRRGYEAFSAGDMATLGELFAEDAVWHVGGRSVLSGKKQGRDAILGYFGELGTRSAGSLKVTVQDIIGGENHTVALQHTEAENNGKNMDTDGALAFQVRDGKITEVREFFDDTAEGDEFWA